jgi:E3 ubiquitin-protein ligase HUWE1
MTQEVGQLLQDMGDDVYQQYRSLTRQSSDFDAQSSFSLNVRQFQQPCIFLLPFCYPYALSI